MSVPTDEILARDVVGRLESLARFSDGSPGVTRLAYDDAWCRAHQWLAARARELGLAATPDAAGNLFFHDPALRLRNADRPVLLVGSHVDSVVNGGRYDGAYGAIAGLLLSAQPRAASGLVLWVLASSANSDICAAWVRGE